MENQLQVEECDLCVIGVGVCGLNALHSSSSYLSKDDKVIVLDKRERSSAVGGMWNTTYSFVRLHQPHPLFTVGNKKWEINQNADYLAKREEIVSHFQRCFAELKRDLSITEKYSYEYLSHEEVKIGEDYEVHVRFKSLDESLPPLLVKAKRCIKALGFKITPNTAMKFSTNKVHSIVPESSELMSGEVANDGNPVYIVGGGKTSMDVANLLLNQNPNLKLNFIIGKGTFFLNRATFFPTGFKKMWRGKTANEALLDIALKYDKDNLKPAIKYIRETYGVGPFKKATHNLYGILSPEESQFIEKGMQDVVYDYLTDVVEKEGDLYVHFKSGKEQKIEQGSWFINCTGHFFTRKEEAEPTLSPHGKVLSINKTSSSLGFTSLEGYFLPHMWFRDLFKEAAVYELDHNDLVKKNKEAYIFAASAQILHNTLALFDALPLKVLNGCELNFDKWYPIHRQAFAFLKLSINKKQYLNQISEVLQDICTKYDVKYGLIR